MTIGITRLIQDLSEMGFEGVHSLRGSDQLHYAVIPSFTITTGTFAGREIALAIPAPGDYPRTLNSSIHIKAAPSLVADSPEARSIPHVRNVVVSPLGTEWQYWSYQFRAFPLNPTPELISQINEAFGKN